MINLIIEMMMVIEMIINTVRIMRELLSRREE